MVKRVNALKARKNLGQVLEEVYYRGDQYVIERAGRPMAALVPVWQLEDRRVRRDRLFGAMARLWKKNKSVSPETLEREVVDAVRAARAKGRQRGA
jgi:prevent-host-death family protein